MYTLLYSPGACSMAPHVVLNELNIPFEAKMVDVHKEKSQRDPELMKANPRGQVPVLITEGHAILEGAAIMVWLLDKHPNALLPAISQNNGKDRASALQWLMFGNASLHPAYGNAFRSMYMTDKALQDTMFKAALQQINELWALADAQLAKSKYLAGDKVTAADILITVIANWGEKFPQKPALGVNVTRLIKDISQRPSYQKALKAEQIDYKAAA